MAQKSKKNLLDLNENLKNYAYKRIRDTVTIDLNTKTISFTNIFGKEETIGLDKKVSYYNMRTNRVEQGLIGLQKSTRYGGYLSAAFLARAGTIGYFSKEDTIRNLKSIFRFGHYESSYIGDELYAENVNSRADHYEKLYKTVAGRGLTIIDIVRQSRSNLDNNDNIFRFHRSSLPIMFYNIEENVTLPERPSSTIGVGNDTSTHFYIEKQVFKKARNSNVAVITNKYGMELMSTKIHPDCCGVKIAFSHNFNDEGNIEEELNKKDFMVQFLRLKSLRLGRAPWIAHITTQQYESTELVYNLLTGDPLNFKSIYSYFNPNSDNEIEVVHIEFPYEDSYDQEFPTYNVGCLFELFLYFWFKTLHTTSKKKVYNMPSLCKKGKNS